MNQFKELLSGTLVALNALRFIDGIDKRTSYLLEYFDLAGKKDEVVPTPLAVIFSSLNEWIEAEDQPKTVGELTKLISGLSADAITELVGKIKTANYSQHDARETISEAEYSFQNVSIYDGTRGQVDELMDSMELGVDISRVEDFQHKKHVIDTAMTYLQGILNALSAGVAQQAVALFEQRPTLNRVYAILEFDGIKFKATTHRHYVMPNGDIQQFVTIPEFDSRISSEVFFVLEKLGVSGQRRTQELYQGYPPLGSDQWAYWEGYQRPSDGMGAGVMHPGPIAGDMNYPRTIEGMTKRYETETSLVPDVSVSFDALKEGEIKDNPFSNREFIDQVIAFMQQASSNEEMLSKFDEQYPQNYYDRTLNGLLQPQSLGMAFVESITIARRKEIKTMRCIQFELTNKSVTLSFVATS